MRAAAGLQRREREDRGKTKWERSSGKVFPTLSSLFLALSLPSVFPELRSVFSVL
jgi:hypothetical protein